MLAEDGNFILAKSGPFPRKMEKYGGGVCTRMGTILIVGCATDQLDLCCYLVLLEDGGFIMVCEWSLQN